MPNTYNTHESEHLVPTVPGILALTAGSAAHTLGGTLQCPEGTRDDSFVLRLVVSAYHDLTSGFLHQLLDSIRLDMASGTTPTIWSSSSTKFGESHVDNVLGACGFRARAQTFK